MNCEKMINTKYCNFVKQSYYLYLLNNFKFYILQFFKTPKFLGIIFALQNIFSFIFKNYLPLRGFAKNRSNPKLKKFYTKTIKNNLVKSFLKFNQIQF